MQAGTARGYAAGPVSKWCCGPFVGKNGPLMKERAHLARLTFVLCLLAASTSPVAAQIEVGPLPHYQLPLRPSTSWTGAQLTSSSALAAALVVDQRAPDAVLRARQRLARHILAAGAGLALSAAVTPIYVLPERERVRCLANPDKGRVPLTAAAVVGGLGVAMTVGGATWLGLQTRQHGSYAARRERLIAMAVGALAFALGQTLQGSLFFLDTICHS